MSLPLMLVDAFAEAAFGGNSAAVCLLARPAGAGHAGLTAAPAACVLSMPAATVKLVALRTARPQ